MICDNISVNEKGHLTFAGFDTVDLAHKYGTPLYLMDEEKIREKIRIYKNAITKYFPENSGFEFASKAFSCKQIYRILAEENVDIDVVSCGEIYTAKAAGYPMENAFFHGNNKTDSDIKFAIENGVGYFVVDNEDELYSLCHIAKEMGIIQKILLRLTPGIDPHTHKKISTGSIDSKFGVAIETGQATKFLKKALNCKSLSVEGLHCHVGSQIFESEPFVNSAEIMINFIATSQKELDFSCKMLNLGGGLGVRYTENDPKIDYDLKLKQIANAVKIECKKHLLDVPIIHLEPGRSLVADAGMTLYTIGSVKETHGYKNFVSVDGGMTDNIRYALYESPYTVILASRATDIKDFITTVAGRCCESGDLIGENFKMPKPQRNEILAVLTTGAYNYSMASNYNRIPRPPVVMLSDGKDYIAVKRETFEDICKLDI